jgi:hypothetical protein
MIDHQTQERFIALRAIGWSFARISASVQRVYEKAAAIAAAEVPAKNFTAQNENR